MGALVKAAIYGAKTAGVVAGKVGTSPHVISAAKVAVISGKAALATVKVAAGIAGAIIIGGMGF